MIFAIIFGLAALVLLALYIWELQRHAKTEEQNEVLRSKAEDRETKDQHERQKQVMAQETEHIRREMYTLKANIEAEKRREQDRRSEAQKSFDEDVKKLQESWEKAKADYVIKLKDEMKQMGKERDALALHIDDLSRRAASHDAALVPTVFSFDDPKSYQDAIRDLESQMDAMIKEGEAALWNGQVSISGVSDRVESTMMNNLTKLALRAFNGESDAAIAKVNAKNLATMEDRIRKSEAAIERLLEKWGITISDTYRNLRIKELRLTYEQAVIEQRHREKQREEAQRMREEARLRVEAEQAQQDAELEERRIVESLAKARAELQISHAADLAAHAERVKELESRLAEAEAKTQRAISMAQKTKAGHVYIISNLGSFGPNVFKIGMTRRIDPMERIWELSDASVPFDFDVHGMIYSDDAPALEAELHRIFEAKRVNLINDRREFFNVSIDEIQGVCMKRGLDVQLILDAEAAEWRQSQTARRATHTTVEAQ